LPGRDAGFIVGSMKAALSASTTPDLFGATLTPRAEPPAAHKDARQRFLLPQDLAGSLKHLDDSEIDRLLAAVTTEAERRGRLLRVAASKTPPSEDARTSLTRGKLNAVRAETALAKQRLNSVRNAIPEVGLLTARIVEN
jgi:hypothetical protein